VSDALRPLRVGTRGSALALWQTRRVCRALQDADIACEIVIIKTTGDLVVDVPLSRIADPSAFTRQIDDAMVAGEIDLAVHSLKDLPTALREGTVLAAVGSREDPRDALVSKRGRTFAEMPVGSILATCSLRRRAQLLRARPDLVIVDSRGNVDTRLAKLDASETLFGTVLATAGLSRLGLGARIAERLPFDVMLPAPGQGALAVTARADDHRALEAARQVLHAEDIALCTGAERAFLRFLEGGCEAPVAAFAELQDAPGTNSARALRLRGRVVALDGTATAEGEQTSSVRSVAEAEALGEALAQRLLGEGADRILEALRSRPVG